MRREHYITEGPTWMNTLMSGIENNAGKGLKMGGAVSLLIAGILAHQIATHGPEMSPGSEAWRGYHWKKAQEILAGEMGPADIITRLILGSEAYARDMQAEFWYEIHRAEDRVPTPAELETIASHHR